MTELTEVENIGRCITARCPAWTVETLCPRCDHRRRTRSFDRRTGNRPAQSSGQTLRAIASYETMPTVNFDAPLED
jgi:hypothetical protein